MHLVALAAEPLTESMFLAEQLEACLSVSTLEQRLATIRRIHLAQEELPSPTVGFRVLRAARTR